MRFFVSFIFNGLAPLKMAVHPRTARLLQFCKSLDYSRISVSFHWLISPAAPVPMSFDFEKFEKACIYMMESGGGVIITN